MKRRLTTILILLISNLFLASSVLAHCEIPCGIYDDVTRMKLIVEHTVTIEKSMKMITELAEGNNPNQLVRWVSNKEKHADLLQDIVSQYFMTQRVKVDSENYQGKITALHQMLIYSMKCKQTTDLANVEKLRTVTDEFQKLYFHH